MSVLALDFTKIVAKIVGKKQDLLKNQEPEGNL